MEMKSVDSSLIEAIGYDEKEKILRVKFAASGATYEYYNVAKEAFDAIMNAESKGRELRHQVIDGAFNFCKITV